MTELETVLLKQLNELKATISKALELLKDHECEPPDGPSISEIMDVLEYGAATEEKKTDD